jgi:hypothetical protein
MTHATAPSVPVSPRAGVRRRSRFYVGVALAGVLIAFGGFSPSYWAPLAGGRFHAAPVVHLHALLFFGWTLFFVAQTLLVATDRTARHRVWGLAGISLATAMAYTGMLVAMHSVATAMAAGRGDAGLRFFIVPLSGIVLFCVFGAAAIGHVHRPEVHKRLMVLATVPLLHAAAGRVLRSIVAPDALLPPPVFVAVPPGLAVDLLVVAGIVHDWRTRGRPHPVYLIGLAALLASQLLAVPVSATPQWLAFARWMQMLGG